MKKTLLSIIAGIAVVSTAFALPTPDDRRAACMEKPLERVWVEKTQTCVPINPCKSNSEKIRNVYCIESEGVVDGLDRIAEQAIERYAKNVLKVKVNRIKALGESVYGVYTADNGYLGIRFLDAAGRGFMDKTGQLRLACWAYGKNSEFQDEGKRYGCIGVDTQKQCNDIADFASLIDGDMVEGEIEQLGQKVCWLSGWSALEDYIK